MSKKNKSRKYVGLYITSFLILLISLLFIYLEAKGGWIIRSGVCLINSDFPGYIITNICFHKNIGIIGFVGFFLVFISIVSYIKNNPTKGFLFGVIGWSFIVINFTFSVIIYFPRLHVSFGPGVYISVIAIIIAIIALSRLMKFFKEHYTDLYIGSLRNCLRELKIGEIIYPIIAAFNFNYVMGHFFSIIPLIVFPQNGFNPGFIVDVYIPRFISLGLLLGISFIVLSMIIWNKWKAFTIPFNIIGGISLIIFFSLPLNTGRSFIDLTTFLRQGILGIISSVILVGFTYYFSVSTLLEIKERNNFRIEEKKVVKEKTQ